MTRVHIELQRVQTWLFSVPRLRAMVGANALLGEVLRVHLPALARANDQWRLGTSPEGYPSRLPIDPLADHDDPAADAREGILARDGGHFEAMFDDGAMAFAEAAAILLRRELPGLRFRITVGDESLPSASAELSADLPVLAPCRWTGRGLASVDVQQGTERASVSLDVSRRHEAAQRAESGSAYDLASLLVATTMLKELPRAGSFQDLAGSGYLALIHADGNGVGAAAGSGDRKRAAFFHNNRVLLRCALQTAINEACRGAISAPLIPLMLGGDDVLVVCRADAAIPFVVSLCGALARLQAGRGTGFKLTLGVGVVFARPTIPIHRLHEVAERLAASAKRRYRGFTDDDERGSVVDWAVYTTAWVDDPEEVRRRDWLRGTGEDARVLSQRPVDVLGSTLGTLQGLHEAAVKLEGVPRSQLRYLVEQLPKGRTLADLAFAELSKEARGRLKDIGVDRVWQEIERGPRITPLLDLVEVYEIGRLGRAGTVDIAAPLIEEDDEEAAHGQA